MCVLLLLLQVLLQHTSGGELGAGGAGARNRKPFPKGGGFSEVRRTPAPEPHDPSATDPWQDGRKRK